MGLEARRHVGRDSVIEYLCYQNIAYFVFFETHTLSF